MHSHHLTLQFNWFLAHYISLPNSLTHTQTPIRPSSPPNFPSCSGHSLNIRNQNQEQGWTCLNQWVQYWWVYWFSTTSREVTTNILSSTVLHVLKSLLHAVAQIGSLLSMVLHTVFSFLKFSILPVVWRIIPASAGNTMENLKNTYFFFFYRAYLERTAVLHIFLNNIYCSYPHNLCDRECFFCSPFSC